MDIYIIENNMKRKMRKEKDERKSSKKISDGSDVRSSWNYSSNGFSYYSKCRQYFSAHAHSGVNLRAFVWMAIWLICGFLTPVLSSLFTGMPPAAILPAMACELAVYGVLTGICIKFIHTGKQLINIYISLTVAMVAGRIVSGILKALIFNVGQYSFKIFITSSFVTCLPGIIIQFIFVPVLVFALQKSGVIGRERI